MFALVKNVRCACCGRVIEGKLIRVSYDEKIRYVDENCSKRINEHYPSTVKTIKQAIEVVRVETGYETRYSVKRLNTYREGLIKIIREEAAIGLPNDRKGIPTQNLERFCQDLGAGKQQRELKKEVFR